MPATFPSHAAAVLPLKLRWPHRFDGVALVIGSTAPDLVYPLDGIVALPGTHTPAAVFWFALPLTLLGVRLVRWCAPAVAAHLPTWPRWLALRDYGVLGRVRHPCRVTVWSALLGAASHVVWDGFTHDPVGRGWLAERITAMQEDGLFGYPWWTVTQHMSTVVGGLVTAAVAVHIGRRRLLVAWHGPAPTGAPRAPLAFWLTATTTTLLYPVSWPLLPYRYSAHVQGVRMIWAVGLALLAGAAAAYLAADRLARVGVAVRGGSSGARRVPRRAGPR